MDENYVKRFNELLGVDVTERTKRRKVTRARQVVARLFLYNGYSLSKIARIFGVSRQEIAAGDARLSKYWDKDPIVNEYWEKIKDEEI